MAYVQVPKDLTRVKTKVLFNLTKRQLICFGSAAAVSVPFYLLTRHSLGSTLAACIMIVIALPFFLFAMYEKDGRPLEKILKNIIQMKFKRPGVRPYKTDTTFITPPTATGTICSRQTRSRLWTVCHMRSLRKH